MKQETGKGEKGREKPRFDIGDDTGSIVACNDAHNGDTTMDPNEIQRRLLEAFPNLKMPTDDDEFEAYTALIAELGRLLPADDQA